MISSSFRGVLEQRCLWSAGHGAEESSAPTSSSPAAFLWLRAWGAALPALGLVSCICFSLTKFTFFCARNTHRMLVFAPEGAPWVPSNSGYFDSKSPSWCLKPAFFVVVVCKRKEEISCSFFEV